MLATVPTREADSGEVERFVVIGQWQKRNFAHPGVISLYNTFMGGVYVADQRESTYSTQGAQYGTITCCSMLYKCAFQMHTF